MEEQPACGPTGWEHATPTTAEQPAGSCALLPHDQEAPGGAEASGQARPNAECMGQDAGQLAGIKRPAEEQPCNGPDSKRLQGSATPEAADASVVATTVEAEGEGVASPSVAVHPTGQDEGVSYEQQQQQPNNQPQEQGSQPYEQPSPSTQSDQPRSHGGRTPGSWDTVLRLIVPQRKAGLVIGKAGATVNELQSSTGMATTACCCVGSMAWHGLLLSGQLWL